MTLYDTNQVSRLVNDMRSSSKYGKVANYIPQLASAPQDALGISIYPIQGSTVSEGDYQIPFTLQSISKVFTLLLALMDVGEEKVFEKVGMEPTGDLFNSMMKLELVQPGKPFNPMINAGAIVISSLVQGNTREEKFSRILTFIQQLSSDSSISYNEKVYMSEKETADRNRSLAYFLKDNKILEGNVLDHLDVYFKQCAIEVTSMHVARMAMILANNGVDPETLEQRIPRRYVQIAKTFMVTCGMYNESGEFAIEVGLPAKSGVSGGVMAIVPGKMGISVIGPSLNEKGNSIAGIELLKELSLQWELSMF